MPESQLRQRIRLRLQQDFPGALVMGWPANQWTGAGWPDLLFSDWPLLLGLEVKQGRRSKPTPVQGARHSLLRKHHIPVYVVHTGTEAVWTITSLKEKLPMAFDPALLAELDAALSDTPAPAAEPEPTLTEAAEADQNALDLANGTAVFEAEPLPDFTLEPDEADRTTVGEKPDGPTVKSRKGKSTPTIDDLQDARDAGLLGVAEAEAEVVQLSVLASIQGSIDALTAAIRDLLTEMQLDADADVPQTVEAPAPRRRNARRA